IRDQLALDGFAQQVPHHLFMLCTRAFDAAHSQSPVAFHFRISAAPPCQAEAGSEPVDLPEYRFGGGNELKAHELVQRLYVQGAIDLWTFEDGLDLGSEHQVPLCIVKQRVVQRLDAYTIARKE